jgi:glycosyltransferase involved in cell wall biosynthesis
VKSSTVLWISYPFPPAVSAGVFRSVRFLQHLPENGWQAVVLTVQLDGRFPQDSSLERLVPADLEVRYAELPVGLSWRLRRGRISAEASPRTAAEATGSAPETSAARSAPNWLRRCYGTCKERILATPDAKIGWARRAYATALDVIADCRPSVIFSTAPPHSSHLLGVWLKRTTGLPLVLDFRDPWARGPWSQRGSRYLARVQARLEGRCVRAADAVILNTHEARDEFAKFYARETAGKFHSIYNGYSEDLKAHAEKLLAATDCSPRNGLKICHVGTIYGRRELRPFLLAIQRVAARGVDIQFEQVGGVKVDYDLATFLREAGLQDRVAICPPVTHEEALRRMADADALLLLQPDGDLQVPGKLFEMILFRKPIVTLSGPGATRQLATRYRLGPVAAHDDVAAMAAALELLPSTEAAAAADWPAVQDAFDGRGQTRQLAAILNEASRR